jgi:hypothetical protein
VWQFQQLLYRQREESISAQAILVRASLSYHVTVGFRNIASHLFANNCLRSIPLTAHTETECIRIFGIFHSKLNDSCACLIKKLFTSSCDAGIIC